MPSARRLLATFAAVTPRRASFGDGVELRFLPRRALPDVDGIDDFAELGPDFTVPVVIGLGKVLRILRVARIAAPADPRDLVGRTDQAAELLERAIGTGLLLLVRPRSRVRFVAWTDEGVETVEDVAEVIESRDAFFVVRCRGLPVRIPREAVVRRQTETERWVQVIGIERAPTVPA